MQFSKPQRDMAFKALCEAEERTTGYYCIPPFRWQQLRYDLLTQADQGWESFPDMAFARVRCFEKIKPSQRYDFYRIELNDRSILDAVERENLARNIYPFFVYILTHEMVHLVRLSSILNGHEAFPESSESEESRVQSVSRQILSACPSFHPVLDKFCQTTK